MRIVDILSHIRHLLSETDKRFYSLKLQFEARQINGHIFDSDNQYLRGYAAALKDLRSHISPNIYDTEED